MPCSARITAAETPAIPPPATTTGEPGPGLRTGRPGWPSVTRGYIPARRPVSLDTPSTATSLLSRRAPGTRQRPRLARGSLLAGGARAGGVGDPVRPGTRVKGGREAGHFEGEHLVGGGDPRAAVH